MAMGVVVPVWFRLSGNPSGVNEGPGKIGVLGKPGLDLAIRAIILSRLGILVAVRGSQHPSELGTRGGKMANIAGLLVLGLVATMGEDDLPRRYRCSRVEIPPKIDGRLDDEAWKSASWASDFADIEGDVPPRPRFRTRAKMLWDDRCFYIAAEMEEPHVWGTITDHDAVIFRDNDFEVFLDPDGDNHAYFEFEINPLNTGWDLFLPKPYRDGGPAVNAWEMTGLESAVSVDGTLNDPSDLDRGWSVEIAIPWAALLDHAGTSIPPRDGDRWRVNFSRVEWEIQIRDGAYIKLPGRREDNWVWSPQGVIDMHRPERWGYVEFAGPGADGGEASLDPDAEARDALMSIYQAQQVFRKERGRWATRLEELDAYVGVAIGRATGWRFWLGQSAGAFHAEATHEGRGGLRLEADSRIRRIAGDQAVPTGH